MQCKLNWHAHTKDEKKLLKTEFSKWNWIAKSTKI